MVAKHAGARGARGAPRCRATAWRPSGRGRTGRARAARRPSGSTARAPPPVTALPSVSHKVASARAAHCRAATDPMSVSGGHHRARACVAVAQASGAWAAIETCRQGMRDAKFGGCMHCCLRGGRGTRQQALVHGRQPAQLDFPVGARAGQAQRGERLVVEGRAAQRRVPRLAAARGGRQADLRQRHGVQGSTLSLALRCARWPPGRPAAARWGSGVNPTPGSLPPDVAARPTRGAAAGAVALLCARSETRPERARPKVELPARGAGRQAELGRNPNQAKPPHVGAQLWPVALLQGCA